MQGVADTSRVSLACLMFMLVMLDVMYPTKLSTKTLQGYTYVQAGMLGVKCAGYGH